MKFIYICVCIVQLPDYSVKNSAGSGTHPFFFLHFPVPSTQALFSFPFSFQPWLMVVMVAVTLHVTEFLTKAIIYNIAIYQMNEMNESGAVLFLSLFIYTMVGSEFILVVVCASGHLLHHILCTLIFSLLYQPSNIVYFHQKVNLLLQSLQFWKVDNFVVSFNRKFSFQYNLQYYWLLY